VLRVFQKKTDAATLRKLPCVGTQLAAKKIMEMDLNCHRHVLENKLAF
jgi:hypothetical protein